MDPEPAIFCNQARLPMVGLGHQLIHKILNLQPVVPTRFAGAMVPFILDFTLSHFHACMCV